MTRFIARTVAVVAAVSFAFTAAAQSDTAFTYQGELTENGSPANGTYDIDFRLWDAAAGGLPIGSQIMFNDLPVSDGRFAVELDFGADAFNNAARWLGVTVNGVELSPRQPITRAPYSIQTRGIFVADNELVGIGTTSPEGPLHVLESSAGAVTAQAESIAVFERVGDGFISILTPDDRERGILFGDPESSVNGVIVYNSPSSPDGFGFRTGGNVTRMVIDGFGFVGIGTTSPNYPLQVEASSINRTIDAINSLGNGRAVQGTATATGFTNFGVYGRSDSTVGRGVQGLASTTRGTNYAVYGQSNSASGFDFYAAGAGMDYGTSSSIRWKRNIEPIDDPLDKLSKIRGVYFDWDEAHGGKHDVGMIAEEVGEVLPEIVVYEENGVYAHGMDYGKLTPLLVEALKAQQREIDGLKAQLESLQSTIDRLTAVRGAEAERSVSLGKEAAP